MSKQIILYGPVNIKIFICSNITGYFSSFLFHAPLLHNLNRATKLTQISMKKNRLALKLNKAKYDTLRLHLVMELKYL